MRLPCDEGCDEPTCPTVILYTSGPLCHLLPAGQLPSLDGAIPAWRRPSPPSYSHSKSPGALSRFFNQYRWNTRSIIRQTRQAAIASLLSTYGKRQGRRPRLVVMIDLSTLEKTGRFEKLDLVSILNKKRGIHDLVAGPLRVPWSFRLWRGKGEASASVLALKLLRQLPQPLTQQFRVLVLADGGFGNICFLEGIHKLGLDAVVGMRSDRCLEDGRQAGEVRSGESVTPTGLSFPVTVARYYLKRQGRQEMRVVVATFAAKGSYHLSLGKTSLAYRDEPASIPP